jgi:tetratricopeptide (TPR) repeat protein
MPMTKPAFRVAALGLALMAAGAGTISRADALSPAIDMPAALDAYARGAFDKALEPARRLPPDRMTDLGLPILQAGRVWVDRAPDERPRRVLVAAAFALEMQHIRAERGGWTRSDGDPPCTGACVLEWACALLLSRGEPDADERTWMLASVALAGGVRDWGFLQSPLTPPGPRTQPRGHLLHAQSRFPDEPRFKLARAVAIASRLAVLPEMDAPREGEVTGPAPAFELTRMMLPNVIMADPRVSQMEYARQQLTNLIADPTVGPEAKMRLAYLGLRARAYDEALVHAREAARETADPDVKYSAWYLAAQAAQALGDLKAAEAMLASALDARPHSQSATLGLAALRYRRGDAEPAYGLIESAFRERPADDDPWRMFLYGDFARLPSLIAELRRRIGAEP